MTANEVQAPVSIAIQPRQKPDEKWRREQRAFFRLLGDLLKTERGKYVAIHDEKVVASGTDLVEVALRAYSLCGPVAIYVDLVDEHPLTAIRIPQYRQPAVQR